MHNRLIVSQYHHSIFTATPAPHSECLDGNVTCFEDYVPSTTGQLNKEQLLQLKDELVQLFYFQYNHEDHVLIDIRHIHQHPTTSKP